MSDETTAVVDAKPDPKALIAGLVDERLDAKLNPVLDALNKLTAAVTTKAPEAKPEPEPVKNAPFDEDAYLKKVSAMIDTALSKGGPPADAPNSSDILGKGAGGDVRIKAPSESYDGAKKALLWPDTPSKKFFGLDGKPAFIMEDITNSSSPSSASPRFIDELSQRERAKCGVWMKFRMKASLNEHERQLLQEVLHKDKFVGTLDNNPTARSLSEFEIKAVLDDSTSGGQNAVPEYFDYAAITTPLLNGELFPYVTVVPVNRGSAADGYSITNPTFVSTAEGSTITPFSTTSMVAAFDTTFFPATCAIEFGRDFLQDAAPGFAQLVMNQINQQHLTWLDEQIAIGDGTTEPQGLFVGTTTSVSPDSSHTFSSFTYNDVLNLAFGITKPHRNAFGGVATRFVMNDQQYKELMQIATGVTGDTRPIFGMNIKDYMLGQYGVSVQNGISNGNMALCNLRGYRLYKRQGIEFTTVTEGRTLALTNQVMYVARMRWGGQMTLSGFVAEMTT